MATIGRNMTHTGRRRLRKEIEMVNNDKTLDIKACCAKDENGNEILDVWDLYIKLPEGLYAGEELHAKMYFPENYPFDPPSFRFETKMFHPNIYHDGTVCISILHTERDDPTGSMDDNCTWTPSQNVTTVCLSIISLLNSPNIYSPANVDASKMLRDHKDEYEKKVKGLLIASREKDVGDQS